MTETTEQHERRRVPWGRVLILTVLVLALYVLSSGPAFGVTVSLYRHGIITMSTYLAVIDVLFVVYSPMLWLCHPVTSSHLFAGWYTLFVW